MSAIGMRSQPVLSRSMLRSLAFWLAAVLLCVPSLKQAVERTPIDKDTVGFKFSKTLELPQKKAGSLLIVAIRTERVALDAGFHDYPLPPIRTLDIPHDLASAPTPSREPPRA